MDNPWPDGLIPAGVHDIPETIEISHPESLGLTLRGVGCGFVDRSQYSCHGTNTASILNYTGPAGRSVLKVTGGAVICLRDFTIKMNDASVGLHLSAVSGSPITASEVHRVHVYGKPDSTLAQMAFVIQPEPGFPQIDTTEFSLCLARDVHTGFYQSGPFDRTDAQIVGMTYRKIHFHRIDAYCFNINQGDAHIDACNWAEASPATFVRFGQRLCRSSVTRSTVELTVPGAKGVVRELVPGEPGTGKDPLLMFGNRWQTAEMGEVVIVHNEHEEEVRILQDSLTGLATNALFFGNIVGLETVTSRGPEIDWSE